MFYRSQIYTPQSIGLETRGAGPLAIYLNRRDLTLIADHLAHVFEVENIG